MSTFKAIVPLPKRAKHVRSMEEGTRLNLGCGARIVEGWVNVDFALGATLAKIPFFRIINRKLGFFRLDWDQRVHIHNLTRAFPWGNESAIVVYSSHTLEHLSRDQGLKFLKECHRILKRGGVLRIVVPDLRVLVDAYTSGELRADVFVEQLGVLPILNGNWIKDRLAPLIQFPHKCMYDRNTLIAVLSGIGFQAETKLPFESDIDDIDDLEMHQSGENAVIVEARKR